MGQEAARVLSPLVASSGVAEPRIEAIRPTSGASSGGTAVAITGVNFLPGSTLTIGGVPVVHVEVSDSNNLTATTGPRDPGPADIVLTNPDGRSATMALGFTYVTSPDPATSGGCSGSGANPSLLLLVPVLVFIGSRASTRRRVRSTA